MIDAEDLDWKHSGTRVRLTMPDGSQSIGKLDCDAWFDGEDEVPVFKFIPDDSSHDGFDLWSSQIELLELR